MKTKAPIRRTNAQIPKTLAAMTRKLEVKAADWADDPGGGEVPGGKIDNDEGVTADVEVLDGEDVPDGEVVAVGDAEKAVMDWA